MKAYLCALALIFPAMLPAQDKAEVKPEVHVAADARVDFTEKWVDSHVDHDASGFEGRYLNVMVDGRLNEHFSFSFRHRLNKTIQNGRFFDATDWMYLTYSPFTALDIAAGKQVVCVGGYEYDRAPINIYWGSEFWNNIPCYQFGASVTVHLRPSDSLTFQACQSPFHAPCMQDIYAYNLQWNGAHGPWQTIWSVNVMEYARGSYINYISLGNRVAFGHFAAELDFMNRASRGHCFFFKDCSAVVLAEYRVTPWLNPFVKYTYDVNRDNGADLCVLPGTEIHSIGAGIEGWPLNKGRNEVRVHADAGYMWGRNGNPSGTLRDRQVFVNVGLKWRFQIIK